MTHRTRMSPEDIEAAWRGGRRDFSDVWCEPVAKGSPYGNAWEARVKAARAEWNELFTVVAKLERANALYDELNTLFRVRDVIFACTPVGVPLPPRTVAPFTLRRFVVQGARLCGGSQGPFTKLLPRDRCVACGAPTVQGCELCPNCVADE